METTYSPYQRTAILEACVDHDVAYCAMCRSTYGYSELGALRSPEDQERTGQMIDQTQPGHHCPDCGEDLTQSIEEHLEVCPEYRAWLRAERARQRARD
jgi:hypothetical protein